MRSAKRPEFAALWLMLTACGPSPSPKEIPLDRLPPYTAEAQGLFDDSIAPEVFGLEIDRSALLDDPRFRARAQQADLVFRAKLATVTHDQAAGHSRYIVVFQRIGAPIVGHEAPPEVEVTVGRGSPSLTLLRSMAGEAVGKKTTVLLRRYRKDDERVLHFRAEPDSSEILQAIRDARRAPGSSSSTPDD